MSNFYETLKELLQVEGISELKFSKMIQVPNSTINGLKRFYPSVNLALKVADYFSTSIDYFEGKTDVLLCVVEKEYKINFYENMIKEIYSQKLTQAQVRRETGISESTFERWKKGFMPKYCKLLAIANCLNCSIDKLLGRKYHF